MAFDWTTLIGPTINTLGGLYTANQGANSAQNIATQQAQASQFRPIGVTTRFGTSGFQYDPATGRLVGAGYQAAPDIAAMREGLLGLSGGALQQAQLAQAFQPQVNQAAQGLFGLGQGYLAQSPQMAAQNWMAQQQQLLAPGREQELARLENREYGRGTLGLGVGATREGYTAPAPMTAPMTMAAPVSTQMPQDSAPMGIQPMGSRTPPAIAQAIANRQPVQVNPLAKPSVPTPMGNMEYTGGFSEVPQVMSNQLLPMPTMAQQQPMMSQGLAASNPRFAALYNARALQDAQLAAQAQQAGMQQAQFGQDLLTGGLNLMQGGYATQQSAFAPFNTAFQGATGIENQALNAMTQGTALGSQATAAARQAAAAVAAGQQQAQQQQQSIINQAIKGLSDPIAQLLANLNK